MTAGINSNNCTFIALDCTNCSGWAVRENSFLGNNYYSCHISVCYSGSYWAASTAGVSNFMNCYAEAGTVGNMAGQFSLWIGGNHGAGFARSGSKPAIIQVGYQGYLQCGPIRVQRFKGDETSTGQPTKSIAVGLGERTASYKSFLWFGASDDAQNTGAGGNDYNVLPVWHWSYDLLGAGLVSLNYADPGGSDGAKHFLAFSGSQHALGGGHLFFPKGFYLGHEAASRRRWSFGSAAPTTGTWAVGDRVFNISPTAGRFVGWECITAGTPGTWKPFGRIESWLTPAQITSDQNAYNPGNGSVFRISSDATRNLRGIVAGVEGDEHRYVNVGSFDIVLNNQHGSATAADRIITGTGTDIVLEPDDTAILAYDPTTQRWRVWG
jgi:hypothetical protein